MVHAAVNPGVEIGDKAGVLFVDAFFVQPLYGRVKRNIVSKQPVDEANREFIALRKRIFNDFVVTQSLGLGFDTVNNRHECASSLFIIYRFCGKSSRPRRFLYSGRQRFGRTYLTVRAAPVLAIAPCSVSLLSSAMVGFLELCSSVSTSDRFTAPFAAIAGAGVITK
jgi:hypothetical protein